MLKWFTGRKDTHIAAQRLYDAIVAQSRLPVFYRRHGVPDTVTGRFEMIVLHMFLVLERLQAEQGADADRAAQIGQALNEAFIGDMDSAMREMGVADVRVGQRMHQTAGAFFGRLMAYRKALDATQARGKDATDHLADAIARNVLADLGADDGSDIGRKEAGDQAERGAQISTHRTRAAAALASYVRTAAAVLSGFNLSVLNAGAIVWPAPEEDIMDSRR